MNSVFHNMSLGACIQKKWDHLGFIGALLIAAGCFYFLLGHLSHSLWFDESQTATIVSAEGVQQLIQTAMQERPYPPLYFLITRLSWKVESNEFGLRLPSALFGALTVVMLFILGRRMSGVLTGSLAALLLVFSPGLLFYFADANAYALLTLLTTLATYFFYKVWQRNKPSDWLCYSLISLLGLATHQVYIFVLASQGLVGLLFFYPWKQLRAVPLAANLGELWKRRKWFILGLVVLGGCWVGWVLFYFSHGGARVPLSIARLWSSATTEAFYNTFFRIVKSGASQGQLFPVLVALGTLALWVRERRHFLFLLILCVFPLITTTLFIVASLPFNSHRYVINIYPLACLIAAHSLQFVIPRPQHKRISSLLLLLGLSFLLGRFIYDGYRVYRNAPPDYFEFQDWRGAAAYLREKTSYRDLLLIHQWYHREALDYYYKGGAQELPVHEDALDQLLSEVSGRIRSGNSTVWVVDCTDKQPYSPLIDGLEKQCGLQPFTRQHFKYIYVLGYSLAPDTMAPH